MDTSNRDRAFNPATGSLVGFNKVVGLGGEDPNNIVKNGFSLDNLAAFLRNENGGNFPTAESLIEIAQQVQDHIGDFTNPHHTTLDQIMKNLVEDLYYNVTAGSPPSIPACYSFQSDLGFTFGTILKETYTSSGLYRQVDSGTFKAVSTDTLPVGTDYISNRAGIPLFATMNDVISPTWNTNTGYRVNTDLVLDNAKLSFPDPFYRVEETPVTGDFSFDVGIVEDLQTVYTAAMLIAPGAVGGLLKIYQPSDLQNYLILDLTNATIDAHGTAMAGHVVQKASGVMWVSVTFTSGNPTADQRIRLTHLNVANDGTQSSTRSGSQGRQLFSIASPQASKSPLNPPMMSATTATMSALTVPLTTLGIPTQLPECMVTLKFSTFPQLLGAANLASSVLTLGALTITRDQTQFSVALNGSLIAQAPILPGLNALSVSYSATQIVVKSLSTDRQVVTGSYPALSTQTMAFGPFDGFLHSSAIYAEADLTKCVEYLTNG